MELRDKILSSEIRHITDLVNVLSYEMVIIQDFMQQQFGNSFKQFRNLHAMSSDVKEPESPSCREKVKVLHVRRITSQRTRRSSVRKDEGRIDANEDSDRAIEEPAIMGVTNASGDPLASHALTRDDSEMTNLEGASVEESFEDKQIPLTDINIEDTINTTQSDDYEEEDSNENSDDDSDMEWKANTHKGWERGRKAIWSRFNVTQVPGGKKIVHCQKCRLQVSAVPKRLEKHYQRCVLDNNVSFAPESTSAGIGEMVSGRPRRRYSKPFGPVWNYFNKTVNEEGRTIVTCKYCEVKVSTHATRMSKHLQNCCRKS